MIVKDPNDPDAYIRATGRPVYFRTPRNPDVLPFSIWCNECANYMGIHKEALPEVLCPKCYAQSVGPASKVVSFCKSVCAGAGILFVGLLLFVIARAAAEIPIGFWVFMLCFITLSWLLGSAARSLFGRKKK